MKSTLSENEIEILIKQILKESKTKKLIHEDDEDDNTPSPELIKSIDDIVNNAESKPTPENDEQVSIATKPEGGLELIDGIGTKVYKLDIMKYNWSAFQKALKSIEKMSKKLRTTPPDVKVMPEKRKIFTPVFTKKKYSVDVIPVEITIYENLKLKNDFVVLGVYDNQSKGSVSFTDEAIPMEYLKPSGECDLCKTNRYRGKIYIGKELKTGEYKRFGSDCIKKVYGINPVKFLNILDFGTYLQKLLQSFIDSMREDDDGEGGGGGGGGGRRISPKMEVVDFSKAITLAKMVVDKMGYIKKLWDEQEVGYNRTEKVRINKGKATADVMENIMLSEYDIDYEYDRKKSILPDLDFESLNPDENVVKEFVDYWTNFKTDDLKEGFGDFIKKIVDFVKKGEFRIIDSGMLAFAMKYFLENKPKEGDELKKPSEWVGSIGEKKLFENIKLVGARSFTSAYGLSYLWMFVDSEGNSIKKFGNLDDKLKVGEGDGQELYDFFHVGDKFTFVAEIKKHEDYKGQKSTLIGRTSVYKKPKVKKLSEQKLVDIINLVLLEYKGAK